MDFIRNSTSSLVSVNHSCSTQILVNLHFNNGFSVILFLINHISFAFNTLLNILYKGSCVFLQKQFYVKAHTVSILCSISLNQYKWCSMFATHCLSFIYSTFCFIFYLNVDLMIKTIVIFLGIKLKIRKLKYLVEM